MLSAVACLRGAFSSVLWKTFKVCKERREDRWNRMSVVRKELNNSVSSRVRLQRMCNPGDCEVRSNPCGFWSGVLSKNHAPVLGEKHVQEHVVKIQLGPRSGSGRVSAPEFGGAAGATREDNKICMLGMLETAGIPRRSGEHNRE